MTTSDFSADTGRSSLAGATRGAVASRHSDALEHAVDLARLASSMHETQPWLIELENDGITLRADRGRLPRPAEPLGRALLQSIGAALLSLRVGLAELGWAVAVERFPRPEDPDLLAQVRPLSGRPDSLLAALAPQVSRRCTDRRGFSDESVPDELLRALVGTAAREDTLLVPVLGDHHRRLVARLTQQADGLWDTDQTLILLATHSDGPDAWLRSGEAQERVLLELACAGWAGSSLTEPIEVPLTRTQLRSALTWNAHPQLLLRIGRAIRTMTPGRRSEDAPRAPSQ
jgi:hypothetical protein